MRPVADPADETMLHRIEADVVDVARKIIIIADGVLPIVALPDAFSRLASLLAARGKAGRPRENPPLMRFQRRA